MEHLQDVITNIEELKNQLANSKPYREWIEAIRIKLDAIDATGFGLTLGVHSRIEATVRKVIDRLDTGNVYINRNMIGAVVGTQPFGGSGLSGTGFKAGGPHYLMRFAQEQVISVNTAAAGGNASLIAMGDG